MSIRVFIYSRCSTCQRALSFLRQRKVLFQCKEITDEPPSTEELQRMLHYREGNLKKLFNTSGQLYRELQLSEKLKDMALPQALLLLSQHGMLVKRPFLLGETFGLMGFCEIEWSKKFANER